MKTSLATGRRFPDPVKVVAIEKAKQAFDLEAREPHRGPVYFREPTTISYGHLVGLLACTFTFGSIVGYCAALFRLFGPVAP